MVEFRAPKGIPDYFPPRSSDFLTVRDALTRPARNAGYGYVELPVFEETGLFVRGVGESTDVVSKEMFTFSDRAGRSLTLRPEGTAPVMRLVVENNLTKGQLPVKVWYSGPFFRAERPQHGRYRQLQQVGVEAIGGDDPAIDAEVIALAAEGYRNLGLVQYELEMTSLGCHECRPHYREQLTQYLDSQDLDSATVERSRINPLRVLDDKRPEMRKIIDDAPTMVENLCSDCASHYDDVRGFLRVAGIGWAESPRLVRGLDYYTRTTFEFRHDLLGAQSGIGGGGRYDGLMSSLGGPELSGIGFGLGVDRTLLAAEAERIPLRSESQLEVFVVPVGPPARAVAVEVCAELRSLDICVAMAFGSRSLKGAMKAADRSGARWVILVGDDELADGAVIVKDMTSGDQHRIVRNSLGASITDRVTGRSGKQSGSLGFERGEKQ